MLETLSDPSITGRLVYGMNCGTVGFLMNDYSEDGLVERLREAEEEVINPLAMSATCVRRQRPQGARDQRWSRF